MNWRRLFGYRVLIGVGVAVMVAAQLTEISALLIAGFVLLMIGLGNRESAMRGDGQ